MTTPKIAALALALGALTAAGSAHAQQARSATDGLVLGVHLNGSALSIDDFESDPENGGGLALQLGWNFTPRLGVFLAGSAANMEDSEGSDAGYVFAAGDLGLRYTFASPARALAPYVDVAFTAISATSDDVEDVEVELRGKGFSVGGGLQYFLSRRFALDGELRFTSGSFDELVIDGDSFSDGEELDVTATRLNLGVKFYPMGGR
jgi:opacity protein-like surface antigen